ncbi:MAG: VanZ family protein [Phycisphaerae bacterium]
MGFLLRYYVELLAALAVLFVLQTGLVPFDFAGVGTETGSTVLFGATVTHLTFPDIVSNIFLYLPIGILVHWSLCRAVPNRTLALLVTIILAAALSGGIEWIQAYSILRVSSIIDFVSNVAGATLGASLSWVARWIVPRLMEAAILEVHERPQTALLKAYCVVLVIFAAIPFSFSFDAVRLHKAIKSANFVPFAVSDTSATAAEEARAAGSQRSHALTKWQHMKRWSRWAAQCASFAVFAWLLQAVLWSDYGFSRGSTTALVWYLGGMFAVSLSVLQLPIVSRACDVTDILFRLFGVGLGLVTRSIHLRDSEHLPPALQARRWRKLAKIGCAATVGYIFYTGLIPLTFNASTTAATASLSSEGFLPFFAYFLARFDLMMADAMEKFASYLVFSALLAVCWTRVSSLATKPRLLAILAVGVALSVGIEITQLFIPVRVTSLTDPILACGACLTGVLAQQHGARFYRFATSTAALGPDERQRIPAGAVRRAPSDVLVATLMEPRVDAPAEPSPMRTPRPQR